MDILGSFISIPILKYLPLVTLIILITLLPISRNLKSTEDKVVSAPLNHNLTELFTPSTNNTFRSICYSALTLNHFNIFNHWIIYQVLTLSNTI
jgi:hypothetical protein